MSIKLLNAISLSMFPTADGILRWTEVPLDGARTWVRDHQGVESYVGHADTARLFSNLLGVEVPVNRTSATLGADCAIIGQYSGPRLPEGATSLPEGATIRWFLVSVHPTDKQSNDY